MFRVVERGDGLERAVFIRFTADYRLDLGFQVIWERREGDGGAWRGKYHLPLGYPSSFPSAYQVARSYIAWLPTL
jgi:hypothetical protein